MYAGIVSPEAAIEAVAHVAERDQLSTIDNPAPEVPVARIVPDFGEIMDVQGSHNKRTVATGEDRSVHFYVARVPSRVTRHVKPCIWAVAKPRQILRNVVLNARRFECSSGRRESLCQRWFIFCQQTLILMFSSPISEEAEHHAIAASVQGQPDAFFNVFESVSVKGHLQIDFGDFLIRLFPFADHQFNTDPPSL